MDNSLYIPDVLGRKSPINKWRLGEDSEVALYAVLLRLFDQDIEQRKDPQLKRSLNGVRRDWRQLHRRGTSDSSASDVKLDFEYDAGFQAVVSKIPNQREAIQIVIEVAAAEPWLIDRVLAERRQKEVSRAVKERVLSEAISDFPFDSIPVEDILSQLYPSVFRDPGVHARRFRAIPATQKLRIGGALAAGTVIGAYTGNIAGPFIGHAIGGFIGLQAAAAASAGMALLDGGSSVADLGGLAGGTLVPALLIGTEQTALLDYGELAGANIETEIKKTEVLVRACCTSEDPASHRAGIAMIETIDDSIRGLKAARESLVPGDEHLRKSYGDELDFRIRMRKSLRDVKPLDKGVLAR